MGTGIWVLEEGSVPFLVGCLGFAVSSERALAVSFFILVTFAPFSH